MRKHLTPSMIVALIALLVSLSGGAYAATKLTGADIKNSSLTGADIKSSSLTGADIKNSSLTGTDVKSSTLTGQDIKDGTITSTDLDPAVTKTLADLQKPAPSEPIPTPIATGLVSRTGTATIPAGQTGQADAVCEPGLGIISGAFRTTGKGRVTASEYTRPNTWSVSYDNTDATSDATVTAIAYCVIRTLAPLPLP
jgi:hypothetical protein